MKIAVIGCGVMGSAFARQFSLHKHRLVLCDHHAEMGKKLAEELDGVFEPNVKAAIKEVEIILLAVKPKDVKAISLEMGPLKDQILVSIVAGASQEFLRHAFPQGTLIRSMPNLALLHGESVIAVVQEPSLSAEVVKKVDQLFQGLGLVFWTPEDKIDAITALAGSGPAFIIEMIEAMVEGGIAMGLAAPEALKLVLQTISGAVALVEHHEGHPGDVRWKISAPGGTTIAGIVTLEEQGVRSGIIKTLLSTYLRAKEIL